MIDDLAELAVTAAADLVIDRAAKTRRWVRVMRMALGLLFICMVIGLVYITFRYA